MLPLRHQVVVGLPHGMLQVAAANEPPVHQEILLAAGTLGELGLAHEAQHLHEVGGLLHGHQPLVVLPAVEVYDALAERGARFQVISRRREPVHLLSVVHQVHGHLGVGQRHPGELLDHVLQLHAIALQELAPGRDVEEEALDRERGAGRGGAGLVAAQAAAFDRHAGADLLIVLAGPQFHLGHGRDAGQRLAPEALRADGAKVLGGADLAGGMALEAGPGVVGRHPRAIVGDLHQGAAGVLHHQRDAPGTGVNRVLQQFLHHRGGALHHLASRDLVGHVVRQEPDHVAHQKGSRSKARERKYRMTPTPTVTASSRTSRALSVPWRCHE